MTDLVYFLLGGMIDLLDAIFVDRVGRLEHLDRDAIARDFVGAPEENAHTARAQYGIESVSRGQTTAETLLHRQYRHPCFPPNHTRTRPLCLGLFGSARHAHFPEKRTNWNSE